MAVCGNCSSHTSRLLSTMTRNGKLLPSPIDQCPKCAPELFTEGFSNPSDRKIWPEHVALPDKYKLMPDGSLVAKDELLSDIDAEWQKDPDAERRAALIEHKRRTRRTRPMTHDEIRAMENAWTPVVRQAMRMHDEAVRADELHTEQIVEKYVRQSHDETIH